MSGNDKKKKAPLPTFSGMGMPMNVSVDVDDDIGEETTRRVGGFTPSFEPVSFQSAPAAPSFHTGPSFSTAPQKASAPAHMGGAPMVRPAPPPSKPQGWVLSDAPVLPEFHPLERTAVFVPHTSAREVATRLSDILRERSIDATYDNVKAKVRCMTPDHVDFRIRLYRGRNHYSHGIIVEVQRRFGTSVNFHNITTAILDAAEGKAPPPPPPLGGLPLVSEDEEGDDYEPNSAASLDFIAKLLSHPGYDAHYLAMQTLSSLTDPSKMGRNTARNVSSALLEPNNDVGQKVFGFVVDKKSDEELGLKVMAMTVLSNAIQSSRGAVPLMLREALRPVLVDALRGADRNPQMAFLSAKCVEKLVDGDHDPSAYYSVLEKAKTVGDSRHAALSKQAEKCMKKIDLR